VLSDKNVTSWRSEVAASCLLAAGSTDTVIAAGPRQPGRQGSLSGAGEDGLPDSAAIGGGACDPGLCGSACRSSTES